MLIVLMRGLNFRDQVTKGEGGVWNMMELDAYCAQYRFGDNQPYVSERVNKYYSAMLNKWTK